MHRIIAGNRLSIFTSQYINPISAAYLVQNDSKRSFHFMKKQVGIDPEQAKIQEARKRRKLQKAITEIKKFAKKPKPVEEIQIDIKTMKTLRDRHREADEISEEERQRRVLLLKEYSRSRVKMARQDMRMINQSVKQQIDALNMLKHLSPELYEAAVQPDETMLPLVIEGPSITAPITGYKSPDGDYMDITKQWVQPYMELLQKKFGVGKLIKAPSFTKKNEVKLPGFTKIETKLSCLHTHLRKKREMTEGDKRIAQAGPVKLRNR